MPSNTNKMKHFLGFHNPITARETGEVKYQYQSPFDIFITKFTEYECECGRKFWMPKGSFEEWKLSVITYKMTREAVNILIKRGDYQSAIELLK